MTRRKGAGQGGGDDVWGQAVGTIGGLVVVFGILAAIKDKLGLSWSATVLLVVGVLVVLGYLVWRCRGAVSRTWAGTARPATTMKQEAGKQAGKATVEAAGKAVEKAAGETGEAGEAGEEGAEAEEVVAAHPQLTADLRAAGVLSRDELVRAGEVSIEKLPVGTRYDFLMPPGRTYKDVEKRLGNLAGVLGVTRLHTKLERSRRTERQVQLLVLDEPPFTRPFPPPTREEIQAFKGVPLGHDVVGQLAGVPTFERASLLIGGMTQTGKTTLVNGLITCLLIAYGEFDLYLLDGKFCGLTRFEKVAVRYEASDNPDVFESMVDELNDRSDRRYKRIQEAVRNRQPAPQFRPVFFIVDEAADFFAHDGTNGGKEKAYRIAEKTRSLVAKCLESGISTVMLTQRPSQNAIPVMVRDQFLYRMCLYVASEGTAKVALGDTYFETVAPINPVLIDSEIQGQGVLFAHGTSTLIRGFNFEDEFMWQIADEAYDRQQKALSDTPESPLAQAISYMKKQGSDFVLTSELAPVLGVTETDPAERGKELNKRLGVPSRRSTKGARGYRLEDLTAAAVSDS
ncbi:FtsK/SpoIIIE domain-containing protein [Streptomyces albus]|uniref:FtsK/SpoIIIE domain-containing protein n=1 Tax=Streptomyces albus TaxID=1888 RepID=UPI0034514EAB